MTSSGDNNNAAGQGTRYDGCGVVADPLIGTKATRVRVRGPRYYGCGVVADLPIGAKPTEVRVRGPATTDAA